VGKNWPVWKEGLWARFNKEKGPAQKNLKKKTGENSPSSRDKGGGKTLGIKNGKGVGGNTEGANGNHLRNSMGSTSSNGKGSGLEVGGLRILESGQERVRQNAEVHSATWNTKRNNRGQQGPRPTKKFGREWKCCQKKTPRKE